MKYFISGPITGKNHYNRPLFDYIQGFLENEGHEVVNPQNFFPEHQKNTVPWESYMAQGLNLIKDCDAVMFLPDWQLSKGCKYEYIAASMLNLKLEEYLGKDEHGRHDVMELEREPVYTKKAIQYTRRHRRKDYEHPADSYRKIANAWGVVVADALERAGIELPEAPWKLLSEEDCLLMMDCLKMVREEHKHKEDNLIDFAGYFDCITLTRRDKNK